MGLCYLVEDGGMRAAWLIMNSLFFNSHFIDLNPERTGLLPVLIVRWQSDAAQLKFGLKRSGTNNIL